MTTSINPVIYDFLRQVAQNNNRAWFDEHRDFYEAARLAFADYCEHFIEMVNEVDPSIGPLEVKNCVYRIYRDTRFSPDKSPYKRHMCIFAAPGGKNSRLPGYYLHIQPGNNIFGSGQYCLSSEDLKRLRTEVCNFPEDLHAIVSDDKFKSCLELSTDEKLKKLPKGYEIEEQYAEYLKHKSLCSIARFSDDMVLSTDFDSRIHNCLMAAKPLNDFFRRALETEPEEEYDL